MDEFFVRRIRRTSRVQIRSGRIGNQNMPRSARLLPAPMNILNEYSLDRVQTNAFVRGTSFPRRAGIWSLFLL
jgi:hypothetical protein